MTSKAQPSHVDIRQIGGGLESCAQITLAHTTVAAAVTAGMTLLRLN
jgi:hypothetical protein